jgi:hypothetical protein
MYDPSLSLDLINSIDPLDLATKALFELQLRVARRADELAQAGSSKSSLNLHCWLLAEAEVFHAEASTGQLPASYVGRGGE